MAIHGIVKAFDLTHHQLLEVAEDFQNKIRQGLEKDLSEIKCLPAYVFPSTDQLPAGVSYVLDLGGSNLRAAVVSFDNAAVSFLTPVKSMEMPWKRNFPFSKNEFLELQAGLLSSLEFPEACPLGYCFSYPANALPGGDAKLIRWTKGLMVPGTEGENIGRMLTEYTGAHHPEVKITSVCVINDTVAGLFAGLTGERKDAHIGLIVGTGTNTAALFAGNQVPKLRTTPASRPWIPVNLESGNFVPPHLNLWDDMIDEASENLGEQRFEKAVSGLYLGRLFKALFPWSDFDPESGARGLVRLSLESGALEDQKQAAKALLERSAKLVAAQLAGLIRVLAEPLGAAKVETVGIVAEGGLFWSTVHPGKTYGQKVESHLAALLAGSGLTAIHPEFRKIQHANLIGAAMAALST